MYIPLYMCSVYTSYLNIKKEIYLFYITNSSIPKNNGRIIYKNIDVMICKILYKYSPRRVLYINTDLQKRDIDIVKRKEIMA